MIVNNEVGRIWSLPVVSYCSLIHWFSQSVSQPLTKCTLLFNQSVFPDQSSLCILCFQILSTCPAQHGVLGFTTRTTGLLSHKNEYV